MNRILLISMLMPLIAMVFSDKIEAQELKAYQLFEGDGNKTDFGQMVERIKEADVVFFGEFHNNPICHWLQREILEILHSEHQDNLVIGAEFFEAHDQLILDEYFSGHISENNFNNEARFWGNYETDYKPLVEYARHNGLPFIATNVPRRYANVIFRMGFEGIDSLPVQDGRRYMAPLPIEVDMELRTYQMMLEMAHGEGANKFVYAQAIKDATMAHFIHENMDETTRFYHINGAFHTNYKEGIIWYLERLNPNLDIVNISSVMAPDAKKWDDEHEGIGDFVLSINQKMTTTH
ncbi:MAG: iron-regulated protein [Saprospirales bacterium]|nr:MAG: iron-regulated protein [Saprospirales bacterium]